MSARFGEHVELHSARAANLFHLLNILRAVRAPDQVEAVLAAHPDVATAAKVYPLGLESLMAQKPPVAPAGTRSTGFVCVASGRDTGMIEAVIAARDGDTSAVQRFMNEAKHRYAIDTDAERPNRAPRVFWPSCSAYKTAMYWAGKMSGMDAEPLLEQVPDRDLRLLSSVELAAGALGLPQHSGVSMEQRRN
jgi:phage tail protein X